MPAPADMRSQTLMPIGEIVRRLAVRIDRLAREILPGGVRQGHEWHVPAKNSPLGGSIDVHLAQGGKAGVWKCWASDEGGDALDLVALVECGGDKKRAIGWAKAWLGIDGRDLDPRDRETFQPKGALTVEPARDNSRYAFRLWLEAQADIRNTPVDTYLRARGIDLQQLGQLSGALPGALRYHPALKYPATGRSCPAMIAGVTGTGDQAGKMIAVHRTFLASANSLGGMTGGMIRLGKMTLGPIAGGLIPLRRGASGKPLAQAPDGDSILLTEGIEDGLSATLMYPDDRIAAALNIGNLSKIMLPPAIRTVIIAGDNDAWWQETERGGQAHAARRGLDKAIRHYQSQGREVRLRAAAAGKDLNDELRAGG